MDFELCLDTVSRHAIIKTHSLKCTVALTYETLSYFLSYFETL